MDHKESKDSAHRRQMLERMYDAKFDLKQFAQENHISLEQLARWGSDRQLLESAWNLRHLADTQVRLMISRFRITALWKLVDLVRESGGETARRACKDLLHLEMTRPGTLAAIDPQITSLEDTASLQRYLEFRSRELNHADAIDVSVVDRTETTNA